MADETNRKVSKSPFLSKYILKVFDKVDSGELSDAESAIFKYYLDVWVNIRDQIKLIANDDMQECHRIVSLGYAKDNPYLKNKPQKGDKDYIQSGLGIAMMACESGITWAMDGEMMRAVNYLMISKSVYDSVSGVGENTKEINNLLDRYQLGPKIKAEKSKQKWELARKYFEEERPKHRLLNDARKVAAEKVGIKVSIRRLIEMLPVKK